MLLKIPNVTAKNKKIPIKIKIKTENLDIWPTKFGSSWCKSFYKIAQSGNHMKNAPTMKVWKSRDIPCIVLDNTCDVITCYNHVIEGWGEFELGILQL